MENSVFHRFVLGRQAVHHKAQSGTTYPDVISLSNFPMLGSVNIMNRFLYSFPWEYFVISVFIGLGFFFFLASN